MEKYPMNNSSLISTFLKAWIVLDIVNFTVLLTFTAVEITERLKLYKIFEIFSKVFLNFCFVRGRFYYNIKQGVKIVTF